MTNTTRAILLVLTVAAACKKGPSAPVAAPSPAPAVVTAPTTAAPPPAAAQATPPTTELLTLRDPVEDAYTLGMPKGWRNQTYSARVQDIHSMVATSISPDGSVVIFSGDPSIPQYWSPSAATPMQHQMAQGNLRMRIEPFVPATDYFPGYVRRKFGRLPAFELTATEADPEAEAKLRDKIREKLGGAGLQMQPTVANVSFKYQDGGKTMRGLIIGATLDSGAFWIVTVSGISTTGNPQDYVPMIDAMGRTHTVNPAWQAAQNRKHQQRMAEIEAFGRQMTARHQENMAAIQASAQRHQQRMQALSAQGEANTKAFNERMAAGDNQQRRFLNYINEENTVVDPSGKSFQVDGSYQRYFLNKQDGTYVGGDIGMDADKLRALGLNPDDYEEAQIKK